MMLSLSNTGQRVHGKERCNSSNTIKIVKFVFLFYIYVTVINKSIVKFPGYKVKEVCIHECRLLHFFFFNNIGHSG